MNNENLPVLKPGNESTEFKGKVAMQVIMFTLAIVNSVLDNLGMKQIILDADTATIIAVAAEGLWMIWRQGNKSLVVAAQTKVILASKNEAAVTNVVLDNPETMFDFTSKNRELVDKRIAEILRRK